VDGLTSHIIHGRNREIRQYTHAFGLVQGQALSASDSIELIGDLIEGMSVRDVGAALGVSYQRAHQLVSS
jgi:hypothetical protein